MLSNPARQGLKSLSRTTAGRSAPWRRNTPIKNLFTASVVEKDVKRRFSRSKTLQDSYASTDDEIKHDFSDVGPEIGHSTTGPVVGPHDDRTLATFSMKDKVCVVTGAARGLGNLFARTFVESGSNALAVVDLNESQAQEAADDIVDWFVTQGKVPEGKIKAIGIGCDVSKEEKVKAMFDRVVREFGRVDCLVTAAGVVHNYNATEYPTDKFRQLLAINLEGTFFCAREAGRIMLEKGTKGSIVMIGSMSGRIINIPQPQTPYNASKAGVRHMAASLAVEWAKGGIRVNCLSPGYMLTYAYPCHHAFRVLADEYEPIRSLTRNILDANPELREKWESLTPMGRIGEPEDLKGAIVYLASDASAFTTGIDMVVDGGYCLT